VPVLASDQALFETVAEHVARHDRHSGRARRVAVLGPIQAAVDVPVLSPTHLAADVLRARLATAGAAR
jgi:hypothetical protein